MGTALEGAGDAMNEKEEGEPKSQESKIKPERLRIREGASER